MNTEEKLKAIKAINEEMDTIEAILSKFSTGPHGLENYQVELSPGLVEGVVRACEDRKVTLMESWHKG